MQMKRTSLLLVGILACVVTSGFCYADWGYPEHNDIVTLGRHNHNQFLRDHEVAVIVYTTPWCDHCKEFEKPYSNLGLYFKDHDDRIPLAKIDCSLNEDFCSDHLIPGYPFIKMFIRMHPIPYLGERKESKVRKFIHRVVAKTPKKLSSLAELESARKGRKSSKQRSVAIFAGSPSQKEFHMFDLSCKVSSHYPCFYTESKDVMNKAGLSKTPQISILFKSGKVNLFPEGKIMFNKIEDFMFHKKHPALVQIGAKFKKRIIKGGNNALILFTNSTSDPIVKQFEDSVKQYKRDILCALATQDQTDSETVQRLIVALDVTTFPTIVFAENIHDLTFKRYKYKHIVNADGIGVFLRNVWDKKIDPDYRSEEVPSENPGPIKVLVAKEFRKLVRGSGKQSVIFIQSQDCFDCDETYQLFSKVQKRFKDNEELQFFVMDGDKNELPNFTWSSTPTLVIFPKNPQTPTQPFTEKWTEQNLAAFINSVR